MLCTRDVDDDVAPPPPLALLSLSPPDAVARFLRLRVSVPNSDDSIVGVAGGVLDVGDGVDALGADLGDAELGFPGDDLPLDGAATWATDERPVGGDGELRTDSRDGADSRVRGRSGSSGGTSCVGYEGLPNTQARFFLKRQALGSSPYFNKAPFDQWR